MSAQVSTSALLRTPLYALHLEHGARMVSFAGYEMPVQYEGIIAEHRQCRESAALFDVSHMGQIRLAGEDAARALESLVPVDVLDLPVGKQRYGFFTNASGGILDDLMITRRENDLLLVVNAANKQADLAHLNTHIGHRCTVQSLPDRALLALQGPLAVQALARVNADVQRLSFMTGDHFTLAGKACFVTRSGYTGEDGFEISVAAEDADALARVLLMQPEVKLAGLGARDTLRLEAGLCLHGHDIDAQTTPVQAALAWAIQKVRRPGGARAGGYPGAQTIELQLTHGALVKRVGLVGLERAPVREGAKLLDAARHNAGHVTSGTVSPALGVPIAMGYLPVNHAATGSIVHAVVREKTHPMRVTALPFVPHRYHR
ncbi:MAG: glycine cleavage system aminomethyltransferase GcvT [Caldimonas sp.]|uniref:glycine cleavage system aminomethyltransferase GcvT n=1 Tax=Caldimonas sp. TaxID=2838790 RepID=UPI00391A0353